MQVLVQDYLDLVEGANKLAFFDIEASGLRGDYNSIICVSVKGYKDKEPTTLKIRQLGNDQKVVRDAKELLSNYSCLCGYYSSGFDWPMINTRLLKWKQLPLYPRHHIDMYYKLKSKILTARKSMAHLASWLGLKQQKMNVGADSWSEMGFKMKEHMPIMTSRCESDVCVLQELYQDTRHLIGDVKLQS